MYLGAWLSARYNGPRELYDICKLLIHSFTEIQSQKKINHDFS